MLRLREEVRFAPDSLLEEDGFEPAIPPRKEGLRRHFGKHDRLDLTLSGFAYVSASRMGDEDDREHSPLQFKFPILEVGQGDALPPRRHRFCAAEAPVPSTSGEGDEAIHKLFG